MKPTLTVFGSCRVVTPCQILAEDRRILLNQQNIFGFTHHAAEIFQQFRIITGDIYAPARLWPYINIPQHWKEPNLGKLEDFHTLFRATDLFVIEVSSVRKIIFKAFLLQINRARELLAPEPIDAKTWWEPMVRTGKNGLDNIPQSLSGVRREIAERLTVHEQEEVEIFRDIRKIFEFIRKPVLFVPHFDTDRNKQPIAQRTKIIKALDRFGNSDMVFDPTQFVLEAGIDKALIDLGHYTKLFERTVSDLIYQKSMMILQKNS